MELKIHPKPLKPDGIIHPGFLKILMWFRGMEPDEINSSTMLEFDCLRVEYVEEDRLLKSITLFRRSIFKWVVR